MEKKSFKWTALLILCAIFTACSQDSDDIGNPVIGDLNITVPFELRSLPLNTSCEMYIFRKTTSGSEDYTFTEKTTITSSPAVLKFRNQDLVEKSYRFLIVAFPGEAPQMEVIDKNTGSWNNSVKWDNMTIRALSRNLTGENYCGIVDKTGMEILDGGTIHVTLERMVGQLILDIFKVNSSIDDPTNIISDGTVASVLDRVYKIDINYDRMVRDITFDASFNIIENAPWGSDHTQTIPVNMNETNFQVPMDGSIAELEKPEANPAGSVRIKGLYLLPTDENLRCKLTFYYYATTPKCEVPTHAHTKACYEEKTLTLHLPEEKNVTPLSVLANHYTQNKAGIWYNRIIDLEQNVSFGITTTWGNGNINE